MTTKCKEGTLNWNMKINKGNGVLKLTIFHPKIMIFINNYIRNKFTHHTSISYLLNKLCDLGVRFDSKLTVNPIIRDIISCARKMLGFGTCFSREF